MTTSGDLAGVCRESPLGYKGDCLLLVGVLSLAFLLASTPARNSDVWLHLAAGRAIAERAGSVSDGKATVAFGFYDAHSWMYDLFSYEIFTHLGGAVLVVLKAGLAVLLAAVLVRLGRRERRSLWPILAAVLSLLALGARMLLQPAFLSVVLLAVTLWLLERGRRRRSSGQSGRLGAYGPICLLFALWANLDDWFLLGPLTVALYLIGEGTAAVWIHRFVRNDESKLLPHASGVSDLVFTLALGLLACLLTPFTIHGLIVPAELGLTATAAILRQDPVLRHLFLSPFQAEYFHSGATWSVPGLAYLALASLSGLSFLGSRDAWRSWRLPVWLGLFGLSAWSARAVPFFAVAAGPILAQNVQDFRYSFSSLFVRMGRAAAVMLLLILLAAAWPGWLQGPPYEMRRWTVLADPSLRQAAQKIAEWRKNGRLTAEDRSWNFSPKAANYFAWFCPAEKSILDGRLHVSPAEAEEYVRVREALVTGASDAENDRRNYFRTKRISYLILEEDDRRSMLAAFVRLAGNSSEWSLLSLTGDTAIFGWKDPKSPAGRTWASRFSAGQEAYHPSADQVAPPHGLPCEPEPPRWWSGFVCRRPAGHPDRDAAELLLLYFDALRRTSQPQRQQIWEISRFAALVADGGAALSAPCRQCLDLNCLAVNYLSTPQQSWEPPSAAKTLAYQLQGNYFHSQDDAPSEWLLLALRAAWRGACADPQDALAFVFLGDAYLRLMYNTRERVWIESYRLPFLRTLRAVQTAAAYHHALQIDADLLSAHAGLVSLYERFKLIDLQLHHLRHELRILRAKSRTAQDREQWGRAIAYLQEQERSLAARQEKALDSYELAAASAKNVVERAGIAVDRGLAETALKVLLASDAAAFGPQGVEMELDLLLITGRTQQAREWLLPEHRKVLGAEAYYLYQVQSAAAQGDYEQADAALAEMIASIERPIQVNKTVAVTVPQAIALALAQMLLEGGTEKDSVPQRYMVYYHRRQLLNSIIEMIQKSGKSSDIRTMRGLLALERGEASAAAEQFRNALRLYSAASGIDFHGRGLAEHFLARLTKPRP